MIAPVHPFLPENIEGFATLLAEIVGDGGLVYCLDLKNQCYPYLSKRAETIVGLGGWEGERLVEQVVENFVCPEDGVDLATTIRTSTSKIPWGIAKAQAQYRVQSSSGQITYFTEFLNIYSDGAGHPIYVQGVALDVTHYHSEQNIQLQLMTQAFQHTRDGIMVTDTENRIIMVNRAFECITGYATEEILGKTPRILSAGRHDKNFYKAMWEQVGETGAWEGEVWNRRHDGEVYPTSLGISVVRNQQGGVRYYIGVIADMTKKYDTENQIHQLANYDQLTRLANRTLLEERVKHALVQAERERTSLSLMFVDLDHFKNINDSMGHFFGDRVLKLVAERMESCLGWSDTLARLGSDEFIVVCPGRNAEGAREIAERLLIELAKPYPLGQVELTITASIGISIFPQNGSNFETLLKHADTALFRAKSNGRNSLQFFSRKMNVAALERLVLQNSLRQAIDRQEFVLLYQPQMDIQTGRIVAAEALIRWQRSSSSLVMPKRFMSVAEDSGLILPIGDWVLEEACRQLRLWQDSELGKNIRLSVNISACQFAVPDFDLRVAQVLAETGVDATGLELELTETTAMADVKASGEMFERLRALGVGLSIDDFGTGYSSLAYLKRFPIDRLKIDQSLIRDIVENPDDLALAEAVISLAHVLRMPVVAEGVETAEQFALLAERNCDVVQGYYISYPLDVDAFAALLQEQEEKVD